MKFKVHMKDPDTLHDAIKAAVREELNKTDLPEDEKELLEESRQEKISDICRKWFEYGEYLTVEIDTEQETCAVVPLRI